jgi:hypothetical protein
MIRGDPISVMVRISDSAQILRNVHFLKTDLPSRTWDVRLAPRPYASKNEGAPRAVIFLAASVSALSSSVEQRGALHVFSFR